MESRKSDRTTAFKLRSPCESLFVRTSLRHSRRPKKFQLVTRPIMRSCRIKAGGDSGPPNVRKFFSCNGCTRCGGHQRCVQVIAHMGDDERKKFLSQINNSFSRSLEIVQYWYRCNTVRHAVHRPYMGDRNARFL